MPLPELTESELEYVDTLSAEFDAFYKCGISTYGLSHLQQESRATGWVEGIESALSVITNIRPSHLTQIINRIESHIEETYKLYI